MFRILGKTSKDKQKDSIPKCYQKEFRISVDF